MTRIFVKGHAASGSSITLSGDKAHYLSAVLRCSPGDPVPVTDDTGTVHTASIASLTRIHAVLLIGDRHEPLPEPPVDIILLQGLLKGDKMDLVVQKAVELGIKKIVPIITERSQLRETRKTARWNKIAEEASRQCGRNVVPLVALPMDFVTALEDASIRKAGGIIFWEQQGAAFSSVLHQFQDKSQIVLCVGPEGGFSARDVSLAAGHGFITASLGKRILRAETAAIAVVSIAQYELGDLSGLEQKAL